MPSLDLYGTVDAAICCLDSINYLTNPKDVQRTLQRLHLFIAPGGMLIFDILSPAHLQGLDGQVFLDEKEDVYCVWRSSFEKRSNICSYWMDIFTRREDGCWRRALTGSVPTATAGCPRLRRTRSGFTSPPSGISPDSRHSNSPTDAYTQLWGYCAYSVVNPRPPFRRFLSFLFRHTLTRPVQSLCRICNPCRIRLHRNLPLGKSESAVSGAAWDV